MAAAFDDARTGTMWSTPNDHRTAAGGSGESSPSRGSDYAELSRRVRWAGLLDRRPAYYTAKIGLNLVLLAAGWTAFVILGDSWWQLVVAAWLALVAGQVAFVGHDAGHRQIFRTRRPNDLVGLAHANLLVGVSFGWWVGKHNRHHSNPNHEGRDPDINVGAVAFTHGQARARRGLARVLARYQAYLFFPMLLGEAGHLHAASVRALLRGTVRRAPVEAALLLIHLAGSLSALLLVLSPLRAAVFLVVQQGLLGMYLGCAFAPNHKGMPILSEEDELDFLRRQVLTSRNVRGGRLVDFVLGGLNYQIEHHLFPSMPRPSLRHAQPLVRAFCQEHGLPYCEEMLIGSYGAALRHLQTVAAPPRPTVIDQPSSG
jgi:fatty acid desaturase